jgi:integrase
MYYTADLRCKSGFSGIIRCRTHTTYLIWYRFNFFQMETCEAMPTPKLLDQVRTVARIKHFSLSTERAYVGWIRRFILFHHKQHPMEMAETEIRQFISHLAVDAKISASTRTVALSALLFLYRDVLKRDLPYINHIERARRSTKLPVVFTRREVQAILTQVLNRGGSGVRSPLDP